MQKMKCACADYNTMHCEQGSSTLVIDSSDLDSHDTFEDLQLSTDAGRLLDAIAEGHR